jgi:PAS domain S-box-containing protein
MNDKDRDKLEKISRIDEIYKLIMELASGNLTYRAPKFDDEDDELDAITLGINMLAEELQATTVSKDYLNRIYRGVVDMLIVLNPDNTIQAVNATVQKELGYTEEELMDRDFSVLFARNEQRSMERLMKELTKKGYIYNVERAFRTKKGKSIDVSFSCSLLEDSSGAGNSVLIIAKDISRIKRTEEQLRVRNQELSSFIYRVSHDIKGPLSSILGLTYLAKSDADDLTTVNHYIDLVEQSANRLDKVIADFLELGRLTHAKHAAAPVSIEQVVQEVQESHQYVPEYKEVRIVVINRFKGVFKSKKILVKTILQNLIDNAIKYRRIVADSYVMIEVDNADKDMVIRVKDNGLGMDKNTLDHIFTMFYKGSERSTGSGLGLYIVKSSIEALRGKIDVKSRPGHGTTFTVTLPNRGSKG